MEYETNEKGHLLLGGLDAVDVAHQFRTPVMVYDVEQIRNRARAYKAAFEKHGVRYQIAYASKALSILAIYRVMMQEGVNVDVVSGGELYTALQAGVPSSRIHFHGNNKSPEELVQALEANIGCFVVDSFRELDLLQHLTSERKQRIRVLLRVAPGVTAHTHEYNITGQVDSKFGFDIQSGQASEAYARLKDNAYIHVAGVHCHIGSMIFATEGYTVAVNRLLDLVRAWRLEDYVLNVGGGYGVRYTTEDTPLTTETYIDAIVNAARAYVTRQQQQQQEEEVQQAATPSSNGLQGGSAYRMAMPEFWIEPGRSLVCAAGTTLYTIGATKSIPGIRDYVAVDGGMSDNIRPVMYQAKYTAVVADRATEPASHTYTVVGKLCETGDQLIRDAKLTDVHAGDVLAVFCTGAYGYSMASNYNRVCRPAVVFVERGEARVVVQRESYADLVRNDVPYDVEAE